jgi:hypothetical protein
MWEIKLSESQKLTKHACVVLAYLSQEKISRLESELEKIKKDCEKNGITMCKGCKEHKYEYDDTNSGYCESCQVMANTCKCGRKFYPCDEKVSLAWVCGCNIFCDTCRIETCNYCSENTIKMTDYTENLECRIKRVFENEMN